MSILRFIPNALTLSNALLGSIAIVRLLVFDEVYTACILVLFAALVDFLDGFAARLFKVSGPLGAQLDSLADMISFGLFPALLAYKLYSINALEASWLFLIPLIIAPASVYRLAKFNLDTRQHFGFIGLPTPANTLLWIGIIMTVQSPVNQSFSFLSEIYEHPVFALVLSLISAWLLNAEIPLLSLKIKGGKLSRAQWILIIGSTVMIISLGISASNLWLPLPFVLLLYLIISIIFNRKSSQS